MLLKDDNGKQIILNQNPLTKEINIAVIDKQTQKTKNIQRQTSSC